MTVLCTRYVLYIRSCMILLSGENQTSRISCQKNPHDDTPAIFQRINLNRRLLTNSMSQSSVAIARSRSKIVL